MSQQTLMELDEKARMKCGVAYSAYNVAHKDYKMAYAKTKAMPKNIAKSERNKLTRELGKNIKKLSRAKKKYFNLCESYNIKPEPLPKYYY